MSESAKFPTATVVQKANTVARLSKGWWLTLGCLVFATGLTWFSRRPAGIPITIGFDQGHGLKVGDPIRHRGIDIGTVEAVHLDPDLTGIEVQASLSSAGSAIAVAGSRFWIVRPRINMDGVSGLETAIGSKYIRVVPGESGKSKRVFQGLSSEPVSSEPVESLDVSGRRTSSGLELLLRSPRRKGIHPSAPMTYRGVQVGKVLSVGLAPDAQFVDVRVRIEPAHRRLVRRSSVFWITSGFEVDIGVTGVVVNAESLATIAKGGISFITTSAKGDDSDLVDPGHSFKLHEKLKAKWLEDSSPVNRLSVHPVPVVRIQTRWKGSFLGMETAQSDGAVGIVIREDRLATLLVPLDVLARHSDLETQGVQTSVLWHQGTKEVPLAEEDLKVAADSSVNGIARVPIKRSFTNGSAISIDRVRHFDANHTEDCFVNYSGSLETTMPMIGRQSLSPGDGGWYVNDSRFSRRLWHGSPVIAALDKRLIGMMMVTEHSVKIVPIGEGL